MYQLKKTKRISILLQLTVTTVALVQSSGRRRLSASLLLLLLLLFRSETVPYEESNRSDRITNVTNILNNFFKRNVFSIIYLHDKKMLINYLKVY